VTQRMACHSSDIGFEHLLRDLTPQVLGALVRRFHNFAACEDAVQEALVAAYLQWPNDGMPANPRGWLIQVAARRFADDLRSDAARHRREAALGTASSEFAPEPCLDDAVQQDDTLHLLFMCCHPSLTPSSAIALTLRAVGGLTTAQIASAFLVPEATMAQRISRAKNTIKASGIPLESVSHRERAERLRSVLHVLYLIFNEGYTSTAGPNLQEVNLSSEAIRLTRAAHALSPDDAEVGGLLALMLLTHARRNARTGPRGELIPLDEQDRKLWDRQQIKEGVALLERALAKGAVGAYQLQAAIAALHDEAPRYENTDWPQILALYELLNRVSENPMVRLNHAIAAAMVDGPAKGLDLLAALDSDLRLRDHYRLAAVRAHLLEMSGDRVAAIQQYRLAASRTNSLPERDYLLARAARLSCSG
jgi:RNA polymerase sigma factor (sigma-70 family)